MSSPSRLVSSRTLLFVVVAIAAVVAIGRLRHWLGEPGASAAAAPADRTPAPALVATDLEGRTWNLAAQHGRVVLVNMFATWCPPCRAEMPELVNIARDYQPKGVSFLGLSLDEGGADVVRPFVKRYGMPFPVAVAQPGMEFTAGVTGIPVTVIVDRSGKAARSYVGMISAEQVRRDLDALLAEPAPPIATAAR